MLVHEVITNTIKHLTRYSTMNTTNKTDPIAIANTETTKIKNAPFISTQPEIKKQGDVKNPELPETASVTNDKKPIVPVNSTLSDSFTRHLRPSGV